MTQVRRLGSRHERERQREATFDEIVAARATCWPSGAELSLRAVAGRMGMTAPALYRYVANYQELVDLVAFEIDKAATDGSVQAADALPEDDPRGRLMAWRRRRSGAGRSTSPREFSPGLRQPDRRPALRAPRAADRWPRPASTSTTC